MNFTAGVYLPAFFTLISPDDAVAGLIYIDEEKHVFTHLKSLLMVAAIY
jgi:hypothetical protein